MFIFHIFLVVVPSSLIMLFIKKRGGGGAGGFFCFAKLTKSVRFDESYLLMVPNKNNIYSFLMIDIFANFV